MNLNMFQQRMLKEPIIINFFLQCCFDRNHYSNIPLYYSIIFRCQLNHQAKWQRKGRCRQVTLRDVSSVFLIAYSFMTTWLV